jgi:glycosyltransferase involved in cell wall biosynthesis
MTATPTVSVVIPCCNCERYVGEAIESALAQTYANVEVIVIDDGSTDGSLEVIRSFGERIRWETGPNRGASAARNRGLALARGELIQFLDADDLLHPEKLARMVPIASDPATGMVFCDGVKVDPQTGEHIKSLEWPIGSADPVVYMAESQVLTPAPLHKAWQLREVGGFREDLPCAHDRDLHLRLACHGLPFTRLPEVLYTVRQLPGGLSWSIVRTADQVLGIVKGAEGILRERNALTDARAEALAGMLAGRARFYFRHGYLLRAYRYIREARRLHATAGLRLAYPGRATHVALFLGLFATEPLTMIDDAWRSLVRRLLRRPEKPGSPGQQEPTYTHER